MLHSFLVSPLGFRQPITSSSHIIFQLHPHNSIQKNHKIPILVEVISSLHFPLPRVGTRVFDFNCVEPKWFLSDKLLDCHSCTTHCWSMKFLLQSYVSIYFPSLWLLRRTARTDLIIMKKSLRIRDHIFWNRFVFLIFLDIAECWCIIQSSFST